MRSFEKQQAQGDIGKLHGAEGGRGNKKERNPLPGNHGKGFDEPRTAERHANSAAGQVAAAAKVSEHKAQQAIDVVNHADEF